MEGCEKALAASEFKTDWSVQINLFNYHFLAYRFLTSKNSGGGGGAQAPPAPPPATGLQ